MEKVENADITVLCERWKTEPFENNDAGLRSLRRATSFQASRLKFKTNMADEQMDMLLYVVDLFNRLFGA